MVSARFFLELFSNLKGEKRAVDLAQWHKDLPSKCDVMSFIISAKKKKIQRRMLQIILDLKFIKFGFLESQLSSDQLFMS